MELLVSCELLPPFRTEGRARFQLELTKTKDVLFSPIPVDGPLNPLLKPLDLVGSGC